MHHGHHEYVPLWLLVLCCALVVAVLGVGSYLVVQGVQRGGVAPVSGSQIDIWQAEVERDPSNVDAILGLGYAYQLDGQYDQAVKRYDQVLTFDQSDLAAQYNKGVCLIELGRDDEGVRSLMAVLRQAPGHVLASIALGQYYLDHGDYAQTVSVVAGASAKHPEVGDLKLLYARALEEAGRPDEAAVAYQDALSVVPDMLEAREGLARVSSESK